MEMERKVLTESRLQPVPLFSQEKSFAPCFGDLPPGAIFVEMLREVRLAAGRGNWVQTGEEGTARVSEPLCGALLLCLHASHGSTVHGCLKLDKMEFRNRKRKSEDFCRIFHIHSRFIPRTVISLSDFG
jgi:hypothetical protein